MIKRTIIFLMLCMAAFADRSLTTNEATILAVGPFFDSTDGITPETAITVTGLTVEIYRELDDGSICTRFANFVPTASGGSNDMALITSSVSGMYSLELTAAQLNFTGYMQITIVDTDSAGIVGLPYFRSFKITSANVVDAEYGTDRLQTHTAEMTAGIITNTVMDVDGSEFTAIDLPDQTMNITGNLSGSVGSLTGHTVQTGDSYAIVNGDHGLVSIQDDIDEILIDTGTTLNTLIQDIPTTAEFALRTLLAAEYTIVSDLGTVQTGDTYALANNGTYGFSALETLVDGIEAKTDNLPTDPADASVVAGLIATAQADLDTITGSDGVTLATAQGLYAPAKAGDLMGLADDAITAAKVTDAAWQELIELFFSWDVTTGTYATATAGSLVKEVVDNVESGSGATAEEVRIEMDTNSTKLAAIVEDTGTTLPGLISAVGGGDGSVVVDHDTGGTDALAYKTEGGVGIDNAVVRAYLKSDYDAGNTGSEYIKAGTTTDVNGQWTHQMNLDPETYTLYYFKQGAYSPSTQEVAVE